LVKTFEEATQYLDEVSIERLLKLTSEGKIKLYEPPKKHLKQLQKKNMRNSIE